MTEKTNCTPKIHGPPLKINNCSWEVSAQLGTTLPELLHLSGAMWQTSPMNGKRKDGYHSWAMWLVSKCLPCYCPFCWLEADSEGLADGQAQIEEAWVHESPWRESLKIRNPLALISFFLSKLGKAMKSFLFSIIYNKNENKS